MEVLQKKKKIKILNNLIFKILKKITIKRLHENSNQKKKKNKFNFKYNIKNENSNQEEKKEDEDDEEENEEEKKEEEIDEYEEDNEEINEEVDEDDIILTKIDLNEIENIQPFLLTQDLYDFLIKLKDNNLLFSNEDEKKQFLNILFSQFGENLVYLKQKYKIKNKNKNFDIENKNWLYAMNDALNSNNYIVEMSNNNFDNYIFTDLNKLLENPTIYEDQAKKKIEEKKEFEGLHEYIKVFLTKINKLKINNLKKKNEPYKNYIDYKNVVEIMPLKLTRNLYYILKKIKHVIKKKIQERIKNIEKNKNIRKIGIGGRRGKRKRRRYRKKKIGRYYFPYYFPDDDDDDDDDYYYNESDFEGDEGKVYIDEYLIHLLFEELINQFEIKSESINTKLTKDQINWFNEVQYQFYLEDANFNIYQIDEWMIDQVLENEDIFSNDFKKIVENRINLEDNFHDLIFNLLKKIQIKYWPLEQCKEFKYDHKTGECKSERIYHNDDDDDIYDNWRLKDFFVDECINFDNNILYKNHEDQIYIMKDNFKKLKTEINKIKLTNEIFTQENYKENYSKNDIYNIINIILSHFKTKQNNPVHKWLSFVRQFVDDDTITYLLIERNNKILLFDNNNIYYHRREFPLDDFKTKYSEFLNKEDIINEILDEETTYNIMLERQKSEIFIDKVENLPNILQNLTLRQLKDLRKNIQTVINDINKIYDINEIDDINSYKNINEISKNIYFNDILNVMLGGNNNDNDPNKKKLLYILINLLLIVDQRIKFNEEKITKDFENVYTKIINNRQNQKKIETTSTKKFQKIKNQNKGYNRKIQYKGDNNTNNQNTISTTDTDTKLQEDKRDNKIQNFKNFQDKRNSKNYQNTNSRNTKVNTISTTDTKPQEGKRDNKIQNFKNFQDRRNSKNYQNTNSRNTKVISTTDTDTKPQEGKRDNKIQNFKNFQDRNSKNYQNTNSRNTKVISTTDTDTKPQNRNFNRQNQETSNTTNNQNNNIQNQSQNTNLQNRNNDTTNTNDPNIRTDNTKSKIYFRQKNPQNKNPNKRDNRKIQYKGDNNTNNQNKGDQNNQNTISTTDTNDQNNQNIRTNNSNNENNKKTFKVKYKKDNNKKDDNKKDDNKK
jgi:hypothetical protein